MDMKKLIVLSLLSLMMFSCVNTGNKDIVFVKNNHSDYVISIPQNPSDEEVRAADFLVKHIQKITNCDIPIERSDSVPANNHIRINKSDNIKVDDAFVISTKNDNILIEGGKSRGCIYAVSEILERYFHVRYYSPDFVIIPQSQNLSISRSKIEGSSPNTYRNVNGRFAENMNYKDFHRLHTINDVFAKGYYVHTFEKIMPWQKYFEKHPEYFAYMNGKRIIDQLCLTNPNVLRITLNKLKEEMQKQPDKTIWSVSQNDNFSYCQCDNCQKINKEEGSPAGTIIRFVNKIAEVFPDKIISTLAYQYSRKAPEQTKPRDNVQVMLCTIELNRSKPIATDSSSVSFLKDLKDWKDITNHIYLWDYTVDFAHAYCPFPNLHVLQPNIKFFVENGVKEHFQQSNTGTGHEFSELKSYIISKLLWNPNVNVDSLIVQFTDGYYSQAGKHIRKYIYHLQEEVLKSDKWLYIYDPPTNYSNTFLSAENIEAYNKYFDDAIEAVKEHPEFLLNVKKARMPLQYAIMEIGKKEMFGKRGWYKEENGKFVPIGDMIQMLEDFINTARKAGCKYINESGVTVEDYYTSSKRFVDVQVDGNLAFRKKVRSNHKPSEKYSEGKLKYLTNGVRGANDYKVHWLGWEAQDFELTLDLESVQPVQIIEISSLYFPKSWILHPKSIKCLTSKDGKEYVSLGKKSIIGDQKDEEVNKTFSFKRKDANIRYIKFEVEGTLQLFDWHPSAGGKSWVFIDEIVVK